MNLTCFIMVIAVTVICQGCTTLALRRHALDQSESAMDLRYRQVLDNLAMIAANPSALPAYASIYSGTSIVNDSIAVKSGTIWTRVAKKPVGFVTAFASEALDLPASRTVTQTWTLDPTIVPEKLQAMRCACWWVLWGPPSECDDCIMLKTYEEGDPNGYYFEVADRLAHIGSGWVNISRTCDAPHCCKYASACHGVNVWVANEDIDRLSALALVIQSIARTDIDSAYRPKPTTKSIVWKDTGSPKPNCLLKLKANDPRTIKQITIHVDSNGIITPGQDMPAIAVSVRCGTSCAVC